MSMYILLNRLMQVDEGVATARTTYVETEKVPKDVFDRFVERDPSKNKKYVDWMCKQFALKPDNEQLILGTIPDFDRLASKNLIKEKDIYGYANIVKVLTAVDMARSKEIRRSWDKSKEEDVEVVLDTDKILIISPRTKEASCKYGKETKWCSSAIYGQDWFETYTTERGKLYYVINRKTNEKYAVLVPATGPIKCYNAKDKVISFSKLRKVLDDCGVQKKRIFYKQKQTNLT